MKLLLAPFAHLLAACAVVATALLLAIAFYFALLGVALVTNGDLGGPLFLPFFLVFMLAASSLAAAFVLFPVTIAAALIRRWILRWPRLVEIPIAVALVALELAALLALDLIFGGISLRPALVALPMLLACLLLPLGIYWWVLQAVDLVRWSASALWARRPFVDRPRRRESALARIS